RPGFQRWRPPFAAPAAGGPSRRGRRCAPARWSARPGRASCRWRCSCPRHCGPASRRFRRAAPGGSGRPPRTADRTACRDAGAGSLAGFNSPRDNEEVLDVTISVEEVSSFALAANEVELLLVVHQGDLVRVELQPQHRELIGILAVEEGIPGETGPRLIEIGRGFLRVWQRLVRGPL